MITTRKADENTFFDKPGKKLKHPHYDHRLSKLSHKNNEFSDKDFQRTRRVSTQKKLLKAFQRIGRCLNHVSRDDMPREGYDKVCLILINNYEHHKHDPKIGALNDGYLFALHHYRLGFKIFYLYNCLQGNYPKYLQFFLLHTDEYLTVFYSGRDTICFGSHGIEFKNKDVSSTQFGRLIARDNNGRCKVIFISDCSAGGSVFDIQYVNKVYNLNPSRMLSFSVKKITDPDSKEGRRSHGILTYYYCKAFHENKDISPRKLVAKMDSCLVRFNQKFVCESTNSDILDLPIYG